MLLGSGRSLLAGCALAASLKFGALADSAMHFERRAKTGPAATAPVAEPALETR